MNERRLNQASFDDLGAIQSRLNSNLAKSIMIRSLVRHLPNRLMGLPRLDVGPEANQSALNNIRLLHSVHHDFFSDLKLLDDHAVFDVKRLISTRPDVNIMPLIVYERGLINFLEINAKKSHLTEFQSFMANLLGHSSGEEFEVQLKGIKSDARILSAHTILERDSSVPIHITSKLDQLLTPEWKNASHWSYWRNWYQRILDGGPFEWDFELRIANIPDDDWSLGPKHIAKLIEEIRARFELEQEIARLKEENARLAAKSRFEIGANGGPELDDEAGRVVQEIIWAPIDALDAETKKDEPDKSVIRGAIERLQAGLKWLGSAAGGAAVGNGVNAIWENPSVLIEWIMPVLEAAQRWLAALM